MRSVTEYLPMHMSPSNKGLKYGLFCAHHIIFPGWCILRTHVCALSASAENSLRHDLNLKWTLPGILEWQLLIRWTISVQTNASLGSRNALLLELSRLIYHLICFQSNWLMAKQRYLNAIILLVRTQEEVTTPTNKKHRCLCLNSCFLSTLTDTVKMTPFWQNNIIIIFFFFFVSCLFVCLCLRCGFFCSINFIKFLLKDCWKKLQVAYNL